MSVVFSLLLTLRGLARSRAALHLEMLALRHQLQVLRRSQPRLVKTIWSHINQAAKFYDVQVDGRPNAMYSSCRMSTRKKADQINDERIPLLQGTLDLLILRTLI